MKKSYVEFLAEFEKAVNLLNNPSTPINERLVLLDCLQETLEVLLSSNKNTPESQRILLGSYIFFSKLARDVRKGVHHDR